MKQILLVITFSLFVTQFINAQLVAVSYSNESRVIPASIKSKSLQIRSIDQFESNKKLQSELNSLKAENVTLKENLTKMEGLQKQVLELQSTIEKLKAEGLRVTTRYLVSVSQDDYETFGKYMMK